MVRKLTILALFQCLAMIRSYLLDFKIYKTDFLAILAANDMERWQSG